MRHIILACLIASLPFAATAQVYQAESRLIVVPLNSTDFEVIEALGEGPRGIWCAAASYARARLGLQSGRIYIKRGRGPSISGTGRKGVVFTSDPNTLSVPATQSVSLSLRQVGMGLPVNHANQFCLDYTVDILDTFN